MVGYFISEACLIIVAAAVHNWVHARIHIDSVFLTQILLPHNLFQFEMAKGLHVWQGSFL